MASRSDHPWWFYPAIVAGLILFASGISWIIYDSVLAFEIINFGLIAVIVTYVIQQYLIPSARVHIGSEQLESAQLERQENSFASQAQSLVHDTERLVQYAMRLEQKMATWTCVTEKSIVLARDNAQQVQEALEKRASTQMKRRLTHGLQQRALCGAIEQATQQLQQTYAIDQHAQRYMQKICTGLREDQS